MNANLAGIIRAILSGVGAYFIGHHFAGKVIDPGLWDILSGFVMVLISLIWTWKEKIVDYEQWQGAIRQVLTAAGGLITSFGWINSELVVAGTGLLIAILPPIYAAISRKKSQAIAKGLIAPRQLSGVSKRAA